MVPALCWRAELAPHHDSLPASLAAEWGGWTLTLTEFLGQPTPHGQLAPVGSESGGGVELEVPDPMRALLADLGLGSLKCNIQLHSRTRCADFKPHG